MNTEMTAEARMRKELADAFEDHMTRTRTSKSAIGRAICGDSQLYNRLIVSKTGFNVRTYDEVMKWFREQKEKPVDEERTGNQGAG